MYHKTQNTGNTRKNGYDRRKNNQENPIVYSCLHKGISKISFGKIAPNKNLGRTEAAPKKTAPEKYSSASPLVANVDIPPLKKCRDETM